MAAPVASVYVDLDLSSARFQAGMRNATATVARFEKQTQTRMQGAANAFRQTGSAAISFGKSFGAGLIGGAVFTALNQLPQILGDIVAQAGKIVDVADRVGLSTDALQELTHSAKLADIDFDTLTKSMQIFGRSVGEAVAGKGELLKVLQANGVALRDESGAVRSTSDLLADYADLIRNAGSEQERLTLAQIAFGRGGAEMVTMLKDGAQGLRENAQEARDLGLVINEELLRDNERLGDEWETFTTRMTTAFQKFVLHVARGVDLTIQDIERLRKALNPEDQSAATGAFIGGLLGSGPMDYPTGNTPRTTSELLASLEITPPKPKPTIIPPAKSTAPTIAEPVKAANDAFTQLNEQMEMARDTMLGFSRTLVDGLLSGEDATKALGNAFADLGRQLLDMALNKAITSLLSTLFGGLGIATGAPMNLLPAGFSLPGLADGGPTGGAFFSKKEVLR